VVGKGEWEIFDLEFSQIGELVKEGGGEDCNICDEGCKMGRRGAVLSLAWRMSEVHLLYSPS
jgi:hypothetical protein